MPDRASNTHWFAEVYDRINAPHQRWADAIIESLGLRGDETVLDAGCGSGSVTLKLLERLPNGKVYAVDSSEEMIAKISQTVGERGLHNLIPIHASLTQFTLPEQVDVVFSNSVFHWIHDDAGLFGSLFSATKPGGRMHAQFGAENGLARLLESVNAVRAGPRFSAHLSGSIDSKKYRSAKDVTAAAEAAGWRGVEAVPLQQPVAFDGAGEAAEYLDTIVLRDYTAHLPAEVRRPFCRHVVEHWLAHNHAPFVIDYVRMDLQAIRPAA